MSDNATIVEELLARKKKLAVIGLGYVGLPVALEFAKHLSVVGFDINDARVRMMREGKDPSREIKPDAFLNKDIVFTSNIEELRAASFFIVAVPTPLSAGKQPDLKPVLSASESIGKVLKKGDYVVFESTVYPGCTEEDCVPVLEKGSGLRMTQDFMVGYSPERINPGDKEKNVTNIRKIVSGCCAESLENIASVYDLIVKAGTYRAGSIKVAESAKIIENTQRDLNIALMNELSMIFSKMNINTYDVLDAAGSKWNFLPFKPGLVGGHCIGIDPYYLTYKAEKVGQSGSLISQGRAVNDGMARHVALQTLDHILTKHGTLRAARVLLMGITFKEDVSDTRNSKAAEVAVELQAKGAVVEIYDPLADAPEVKAEYGFDLINEPSGGYDAVLLTVPHDIFQQRAVHDYAKLLKPGGLFYDLKGIYRAENFDGIYKTL